ncbi:MULTISPECIES: hypothetical protein [Neorhizobium]|nr:MULTISPECIES: hypothetical protein [Neorhizobium]
MTTDQRRFVTPVQVGNMGEARVNPPNCGLSQPGLFFARPIPEVKPMALK